MPYQAIIQVSESPLFSGIPLSQLSENKALESFGEPEEIEIMQEANDFSAQKIYHYEKEGFSLFFSNSKLLSVSISDKNLQLFDTAIFTKTEKDIIQLFSENGVSNYEIDKSFGEKQLAFDEIGITLFFDNQKLSEVFMDNLA